MPALELKGQPPPPPLPLDNEEERALLRPPPARCCGEGPPGLGGVIGVRLCEEG